MRFWDGIVGQTAIRDFCFSLVEARCFPQSVIISGEPGTGKDFIAARLASALNHLKSGAEMSAYSLPQSLFSSPFLKYIFALPRGANEESHDDPYEKLSQTAVRGIRDEVNKKNANPYHSLFIEGANEIKINSVRDIHKFLGMTSAHARHKTVLISDADSMNEYAQNSLLKILEEPPENCSIILTTAKPDALRETIRSRCWELMTVPFGADEMLAILEEHFRIEREDAAEVVPLGEGSVRKTLELLALDIAELKSRSVEFLRYALGNKFDTAYGHLLQSMGKGDTDKVRLVFRLLILWLSDAQRFLYDKQNLYFSDYRETFEKFHSRYHVSDFQPYINAIENYHRLMENNNVNKNILYLNLVHLIASVTNKDYFNHTLKMKYE